MKTGIHPKYFPDAVITCSCGTVYKTGSTKQNSRIELCSNCHPFYTGEQKIVDTEGRVDRIKRRFNLDEK